MDYILNTSITLDEANAINNFYEKFIEDCSNDLEKFAVNLLKYWSSLGWGGCVGSGEMRVDLHFFHFDTVKYYLYYQNRLIISEDLYTKDGQRFSENFIPGFPNSGTVVTLFTKEITLTEIPSFEVLIPEFPQSQAELEVQRRQDSYNQYQQYDQDIKQSIGQLTQGGYEVVGYSNENNEDGSFGTQYQLKGPSGQGITITYGVDANGNFQSGSSNWFTDIETGNPFHNDENGNQVNGYPIGFGDNDIPPYLVPNAPSTAPSGYETEHENYEKNKPDTSIQGSVKVDWGTPKNPKLDTSDLDNKSIKTEAPDLSNTKLQTEAPDLSNIKLKTEAPDLTNTKLGVDASDLDNKKIVAEANVKQDITTKVEGIPEKLELMMTGLETAFKSFKDLYKAHTDLIGEKVNAKYEAEYGEGGNRAKELELVESNISANKVEYGSVDGDGNAVEGVRIKEGKLAENKNTVDYNTEEYEYTHSDGTVMTLKKGHMHNMGKKIEREIEQHTQQSNQNIADIDASDNTDIERNKVDIAEELDNTGIGKPDLPPELTDYDIVGNVFDEFKDQTSSDTKVDIDLQSTTTN